MRTRWVDVHSPLADGLRAFVAHKRAMGRSFHTEEKALRLLDRYLVAQGSANLDEITAP